MTRRYFSMLKAKSGMRGLSVVSLMLAGFACAGPVNSDGGAFTGAWRLEHVKGASGFDASITSMELRADGGFGSTVGCNRIVGKPKIEGEKVSFGALASTRMACIGPIAEVETKYLAALNAARSFHVNGEWLTLLDESGDELAVFARVTNGKN